VLCERPLALTTRGVQTILEAAASSGKKVMVGNNHRFRSDVQALDRFLRGGELGTLTGIRAGAYHQLGSVSGWRLNRAESGGGALFDLGLSLVDLALWLSDYPPPQRVWAHIEGRRGPIRWKMPRSSRLSARMEWRARSTSRGRTSATRIVGGSSPFRRAAARDLRHCAW
jgi:predicted dehydrogenase